MIWRDFAKRQRIVIYTLIQIEFRQVSLQTFCHAFPGKEPACMTSIDWFKESYLPGKLDYAYQLIKVNSFLLSNFDGQSILH